MSLIHTQALHIGYSDSRVLQSDLNLAVRPGEIVSLMGQNGVGKTTFLKTIHGLLPPVSGAIWLGDKPLQKLSRLEIAQQCALVLTEKPPGLHLSVMELIAMGRHPYSNWLGLLSTADKQAIEKAISQTRIEYIAEKKLGELSDGQLQKVMIARALAQETDLIILDEPVAHLDLNNKIEVMFLLREIADQGVGILISTHDIQVTTQLSDQLWLFGFSGSAQTGLPEDLILNGEFEKILYLQHHRYDLIHHRIRQSTAGPVIQLEGEEAITYWTEQALKRAGFQVGKSEVLVNCDAGKWQVGEEERSSLDSLIAYLKTRSTTH